MKFTLENEEIELRVTSSPVTVSTTVDERSGRPDIDQANKNRKTFKKGTQEGTENYGGWRISRQFVSEASLEPILKRREDLSK